MKLIALFIGVVIVVSVVTNLLHDRKMKRIPAKSTDSLKALFDAPRANFTLLHQAALELKRRGEDINFAFPAFLEVALSGGVMELIGKGCLQGHFGDKLSYIDFAGKKLSPVARGQLEELKQQVKKLTNA